MNLTPRRQAALDALRELYAERGEDVRLTDLAGRIGVKKSAGCELLARLVADGLARAVPAAGPKCRVHRYRPIEPRDGLIRDAVAALQRHGEHAIARRLFDGSTRFGRSAGGLGPGFDAANLPPALKRLDQLSASPEALGAMFSPAEGAALIGQFARMADRIRTLEGSVRSLMALAPTPAGGSPPHAEASEGVPTTEEASEAARDAQGDREGGQP